MRLCLCPKRRNPEAYWRWVCVRLRMGTLRVLFSSSQRQGTRSLPWKYSRVFLPSKFTKRINCLLYLQALELNTSDVHALVSRSKCYLLLGESEKALNDAEQALLSDKNNIRAIYQKAESLYFLGQFEHSLMFYHRGLRLRPEMKSFRLGVQKTQEAIENTIGLTSKPRAHHSSKSNNDSKAPNTGASRISTATARTGRSSSSVRPTTSKADSEKKASRRLLGQLCVDKEYLENLLKHPDLKRADTDDEQISTLAREAVSFLNNRQEFWRQQRPCTENSANKFV